MREVLDATLELSNILRTLLPQGSGESYAYPQQAEDITLDVFPTFICLPRIDRPMLMGVKAKDVSWFSFEFDIRLFLDEGQAKTAVDLARLELMQWIWVEDVSRLLFANMTLNGTVDITGDTNTGQNTFLTPNIGYVNWDTPTQYWGVYFAMSAKIRSSMLMKP